MKTSLRFSIFLVTILFFSIPITFADAPGTGDGSACDLPGSPTGTGDGVMQSGTCVSPSNYQTQSSQSGTPGTPSGFTALAPIPGLTDSANTSVVNSSTLATFFNNLYKYLIGLAAVIAIIEIIWGGLEISTQDSVSKHADGKERIQQAVLGLVLVLAPVIVFSIINPSILNLSLNLPPLNTASTTQIQAQTPTQPTCGNGVRTNCTPPVATQEGLVASSQPGLWCYQITPCDNDSCKATCGGSCNFVCASTQTICDKDYHYDTLAVSSCKQY